MACTPTFRLYFVLHVESEAVFEHKYQKLKKIKASNFQVFLTINMNQVL